MRTILMQMCTSKNFYQSGKPVSRPRGRSSRSLIPQRTGAGLRERVVVSIDQLEPKSSMFFSVITAHATNDTLFTAFEERTRTTLRTQAPLSNHPFALTLANDRVARVPKPRGAIQPDAAGPEPRQPQKSQVKVYSSNFASVLGQLSIAIARLHRGLVHDKLGDCLVNNDHSCVRCSEGQLDVCLVTIIYK